MAQIVLARAKDTDNLVFGQYVVDYLCAGIKVTSYATNVPNQVFSNEVIPRLYSGTPPVAISGELAHEIVWGGFEFAETLGIRPPSEFRQSQRVLEPPDALPRAGAIQFGYQGRPAYIPAPDDNQPLIISRLIDSVGLGNFYYMPTGEVPEQVLELLQVEGSEDGAPGSLWSPDEQQTTENVESDSSLWVPGRQDEPAQAVPSGLWTPGRP